MTPAGIQKGVLLNGTFISGTYQKLIHSSGNFYKSGSGEQPFVKRKWNRASLTVEASLALPVFLIAVLVLLKIVDLYRLHGMLTVSLQESARYLSVCAYAVDETGKENV